MSITTEISRIEQARNLLRTKAVELSISSGTEKLDALAEDYNAIVKQGSVSAQIKEGETYTIPKGYHDGTGTVSGIAGGGSYTLQSKNITPTKQVQQITPDDGYYGLSDVSVQAIPAQYQDVSSVTAQGADVLSGKVIVNAQGSVVAGTMANNGSLEGSIDGLSTTGFSIPEGYTSGGSVTLTEDIEQALAAI